MKYCPWCGHPLADPQAPFCSQCGHRLVQEEPPPSPPASSAPRPKKEVDDEEWKRFQEEFSPRRRKEKSPSPTDRDLNGPLIFGEEKRPSSPTDREVEGTLLFREAETAPRESPPSPTDDQLEQPLIFNREEPDTPAPPPSQPPGREFKLDLPKELMEDDSQVPRRKIPPRTKKRTVVTSAPPRRPDRQPEETEPPRRKPGPAALLLVAVLFVILVVAGVIFFHTLSNRRGDRAAEEFAQALATADLSYLDGRLAMPDASLSHEGVLEGICQDLNDTVPQKTVENHLKTMGDSSVLGYNSQLSCLTMVRQGTLLTASYSLQIQMVPVTISTDLEGLTFQVDGREVEAQAVEGGYSLQVPPGSSQIEAFGELSGNRQSMGTAQVNTFAAQPVTLTGFASGDSALRIELAGTETNLQVLVNGVESNIQPQRGILVISPSSPGMTVTLSCDQYSQEFTVQGEGVQQEQVDLVLNPPSTSDPAQMTNRQLIEDIAPQYYEFYTSYLDATNQWDSDLIQGVYEGYREELINRMETYNAGLTFRLISLSVDRESVTRGTLDGAMTVSFYIETVTNYQYKDREDTQWYAGGNLQEVTMRYNEEDNRWEAAYSRIDDSLVLSEDLITY